LIRQGVEVFYQRRRRAPQVRQVSLAQIHPDFACTSAPHTASWARRFLRYSLAKVQAVTHPKPTPTRLCDLTPGQFADCFALLAERTKSATREDKPYYVCRFRDARRTATLMVWADGKW